MIFAHSDDDLALRNGAREYLRGQCTAESLRKQVENKVSDLPLWDGIAEQGLLGFLVSEANGGLELTATGFSLLAEEVGYVCLPEPIIDVASVVLPTLDSLGMDTLCEEIISGGKRVLPLHTLHPFLNHANEQDSVLSYEPGTLRLISVNELSVNRLKSVDPLREIVAVDLGSSGKGETIADGDAADRLATIAGYFGAVMTAAELLGLAAAMIDMATAYAKDRHQFGKPIGSYQAVKHHLASALVALEFAKPVVYRAAYSLDDAGSENSLAVAHAKIAASDAAINAAEAAIQVHGGMGYTFEVDLHMWMKRSWALAGVWGDRNFHMNAVDQALFQERKPVGPAATFA